MTAAARDHTVASQRDIRRRIGAVRNIKQITRAMQFVAASKLKRAQDATLAARPYSEKLDEVLADLAAVLGADDHPLLAGLTEGGKRLIVLVTTDRGLAGPLNTNTIRFAAREITGHPGDLTLVTVGRKGRDAMRRAGVPIAAHFAGFGDRPAFADVLPLARLITDDFLAGTYSRVDVVYNRFVSTLVQRPEMIQVLPIRPAADTEGIPGNQFIFEPSATAVLERLVPRYVATRLFQAVLEGKASEESGRMVAMKNATENAEDLIEDLTLSYNKVRQSNITREMIEIASGANAR
jgi:F-type H+-transporting ATPase subunit gamma